ncbi:hypothetical protein GOODEAATRI_001759 [Goodea atripinnis]|uniref:Uncharacterized protein n=1 Tax=Goodea atripinnis TaxID=208336 RepID=A0ABV0MNI9_9TELE
MADSIPLNPVRKSSKRIGNYSSARLSRYVGGAGTGSGCRREEGSRLSEMFWLQNPVLFSLLFSLEDEPSNLDEMPLMMSEEGFENDESDYQTLPRARVGQRHRGLGWFLLGGWKVLCSRYRYND